MRSAVPDDLDDVRAGLRPDRPGDRFERARLAVGAVALLVAGSGVERDPVEVDVFDGGGGARLTGVGTPSYGVGTPDKETDMNPYAKLIAQATGTNDPATLALIEELMRADRGTLDNLTPAQFRAAIAEALADAQALQDAGQLVMWCEAYGLAVPALVAA
jgi:hypothetical protein